MVVFPQVQAMAALAMVGQGMRDSAVPVAAVDQMAQREIHILVAMVKVR